MSNHRHFILLVLVAASSHFIISCTSVQRTIKPPDSWPTTTLDEQGFLDYYENNTLDPIEGIWTLSEYQDWVNVISGLSGSNEYANVYRFAVIKDENHPNSFNGYILNSRRQGWPVGRPKVKFAKMGGNVYEEIWYMNDYSTSILNVILDEGMISYTRKRASYPINYSKETVLLKVHPSSANFDITNQETTSTGSGFLIHESGLIVTNYHVVDNSNSYQVHFPDNNITKSCMIRLKDVNNDIVILSIDDFDYNDVSTDNIPYSCHPQWE